MRQPVTRVLAAAFINLVLLLAPLVASSTLVDFNNGLHDIGSKVPIPSSYQPVPGLIIGYSNIGVYNGGADHTTGTSGGNNYNTYQFQEGTPQVFTFNKPVSLPSLWLATYWGRGDQVIISAYSDVGGANLLGSVFFTTATYAGPGNYVWLQCTNLNSVAYNGLIRLVEFFAPNNANLDDMEVVLNTNFGSLQSINLSLPTTNFFRGMSRQAAVTADYAHASNSDITSEFGLVYTSSDTNVISVATNGLVQAMGAGDAIVTATFLGHVSRLGITVLPVAGTVVDFSNVFGNLGNRVPVSSSYQPIPGLIIGYTNVGAFSGGPDHTAATLGGNDFNTYQFQDGAPQVFTFSKPVSLPSFWLSTFWGGSDQITISAYSDERGSNLLGTVFFTTDTFPGPGNYVWSQCTNLDAPAYNGQIGRVELLDGSGNAQLDDLEVR